MNSIQKKIYDQQNALLVGNRERSGIKYIMGNRIAEGNSIEMYQCSENNRLYTSIVIDVPACTVPVVAKWIIKLK